MGEMTWREEAIQSLMDAGYISEDYPESAAAAVDLVVAIIVRHRYEAAYERERYPKLDVNELVEAARQIHVSSTAWTLDGQAVTVDITHIDEETRDG